MPNAGRKHTAIKDRPKTWAKGGGNGDSTKEAHLGLDVF